MQIQISWLLQKPTDLDLYCLQMQGISGFRRTRVKPTAPNMNKQIILISCSYTEVKARLEGLGSVAGNSHISALTAPKDFGLGRF